MVLALSIGVPVVFIAGARYLAYRLAGRRGSLPASRLAGPAPATGAWPVPTLRFASRWQALRTLLMVW
jgi:hypothetical protein